MTDFPLVQVDWLDSRRPVAEWAFISDAPDEGAVHCSTVGWLIRDGATKVVAQTIGDLSEKEPQGTGFMQIPACAVLSVTLLQAVSALSTIPSTPSNGEKFYQFLVKKAISERLASTDLSTLSPEKLAEICLQAIENIEPASPEMPTRGNQQESG